MSKRNVTAKRSARKTVILSQAPIVDDEDNDPLDMSQSPVAKRSRKSRRIAEKAGPSGWKHADEGDERDMVPPSDDDEYEAWRGSRRKSRKRKDLVSHYTGDPEQSLHPTQASQKSSIPTDSGGHSLATSPTLPLTSSDVDRSRSRTPSQAEAWDTDGEEETSWPRLFPSSPRIASSSPDSPRDVSQSETPFKNPLISISQHSSMQASLPRDHTLNLEGVSPSPEAQPLFYDALDELPPSLTLSPEKERFPQSGPQHDLPTLRLALSVQQASQDGQTPQNAVEPHLPASPPYPPAPPAINPDLDRFRSSRTFRTRTVLQLQPYTREKQIYEAALRKGGLKKGKTAIGLSREISQRDEEEEYDANQDAQSDSGDSQRIVIGNTPPLRRVRDPHKYDPIEADFDEYFVQYGSAVDMDNEEDSRRMRNIVKSRMKAEKEKKRRLRDEARARREFDEMFGQSKDAEQRTNDGGPGAAQGGKTKTYAKHRRKASDNSTQRQDLLTSTPHAHRHSVTRHRSIDPSSDILTSDQVDLLQTPVDTFDDFGPDLPDNPPEPMVMSVDESDSGLPSSDDDNSPSTDSPSVDRRARIARRMMPAAMLRRLEREEARRLSARQEKHRRARDMSPVRPGRAVTRRGAVERDLDLASLFDDNGVDSEAEEASTRTGATGSQDLTQPIEVSDNSSQGSQAHEDNAIIRPLAHLYDGDFESIVSGQYHAEARRRYRSIRHHGPRTKSGNTRRPPLGLIKENVNPKTSDSRVLVQSKLSSNGRIKRVDVAGTRAHQRDRKRRNGRKLDIRPAIRLDHHTLFAYDDDQYASNMELPLAKGQTASKNHLPKGGGVNQVLNLDIGKARSWANFDRFSVSFDLSPLPSGLYCCPSSFVGDGSLIRFIESLDPDRTINITALTSCVAFDVNLDPTMSPLTIMSVVPLLFDGVLQQVTHAVNFVETQDDVVSVFDFLLVYINSRKTDISSDMASLRLSCVDTISRITNQINDIAFTDRKQRNELRVYLLDIRWKLFMLSCRLEITTEDEICTPNNALAETSMALIRQLLVCGFGKTMQPLKAIIDGSSESGEISDITVLTWIGMIHCLSALDKLQDKEGSLVRYLLDAIDVAFALDKAGPIAAERIWYITFGLCALSQFEANGRVSSVFNPSPHWSLARKAISLIKISHDEDVENKAVMDQLRGRDRYIKVMFSRCVRLSSIWKWHFDHQSFSVVTKDLGVVFKDRQHRNFPTEASVDFPDFIREFDMTLTAAEDSQHESAFELYLRLVCVAAADLISACESLEEAQKAEKDVQRLIMSTIPVSPVKFNRLFPPTRRQLGQLINRYSTMIAACYFSPALLTWLLANCRKWIAFESADFDSRQISIRGLMYVAVACRHHGIPLDPVVSRLAEMLGILQKELDDNRNSLQPNRGPSQAEIERTMVLIVVCIRKIIENHSYDSEKAAEPAFPPTCLLHESWTSRIFSLDLTNDVRCGSEVVDTIQAYLDVRGRALPILAQERRRARENKLAHQDEDSFGMDFSSFDLAILGGDESALDDPIGKEDEDFGNIVRTKLSPQIYRLLSDMLPPVEDLTESSAVQQERQTFIAKLTKCWADCAGVIVVEQNSPDGWTPYIGPFGRESWQRLGNEKGRLKVGYHFMYEVARIDPGAFTDHAEDFIALLFVALASDNPLMEHHFVSAMLGMTGISDHPLLSGLAYIEGFTLGDELGRTDFMDKRQDILAALFATLPDVLRSSQTAATVKTLIYRCINLLVGALIANEAAIGAERVVKCATYHTFAESVILSLQRIAGDVITPASIPGLRHFKLHHDI